MNAIYCGNLSDFERQMTYLEKAFEAEFQEAMLALEMVENREAINCMKAEARVILESGTEEDLAYLYTEAKNETEENKKGVIGTIFDKIKNFFVNLWNGFVGMFNKNKANVNKDAKCTFDFTIAGLNAAADDCDKAIGGGWVGVAGLVAAVGIGAGGIAAYLKKKSNEKTTEVNAENAGEVVSGLGGVVDRIKGLCDKAKGLVNGGTSSDNKEADEHFLIKLLNGFKSQVNGVVKKVTGLFTGAAKSEEPAKTEEPTSTEPAKTENKSVVQKNSVQERIAKQQADRAQRQAMGFESVEEDPIDELDNAVMESASLEELEALINNL